MKRFFLIICLFFAASILPRCSSDDSSQEAIQASRDYVVVIDAAHGGKDPGAILEPEGVTEKGIVLEFCKKLKTEFDNENINTLLLREEDRFVSFEEKLNKVEQSGAELILSFHNNMAHHPEKHGYGTFYKESDITSMRLDSLIHEEINSLNIFEDTGSQHGPFYLMRKTAAPSVTIYLGYLSNPDDLKKITDDEVQKTIAAAIVRAVKKFRNVPA
ncbi:MAG: N-acetylmuramoyl-L-alanine amidase [Calditrichaeota bacterium]|nr:MAG: N-acetylmuramoyl-L-alanine amidase [Calditrichota bacterium]